MYDLSLDWEADLVVASGGDLDLSVGSDTISQRVFRRLLTNPGDYIWNLDYGGGLAQFVGLPCSPADIEAVVRTQLALESALPPTPAPQVSAAIVDAANGYVLATITYADPATNSSIQLNVASG